MSDTTQKYKLDMTFHRDTDDQLVTTMGAVHTGVFGNSSHFANTTVDEAAFKTQQDSLSAAVVAAKDGGRKAIAEKNKQRRASTKMLSKLARNITELANGDPTLLTLSGFQVSSGPAAAQPLTGAAVDKVVNTAGGQITVYPKPIRGARMHEIHYGPTGAGGAPPTTWLTEQVAKARPGSPINGLTAGTLYAFQVRAYGTQGWTPWSDIVTKMAT